LGVCFVNVALFHSLNILLLPRLSLVYRRVHPQHWRAMVAQLDGHPVSSNVAPASNTSSVLKNPLLKTAFEGASFVPPLEIFSPETSNVLMTYLLLHDLETFKINNNNNNKSNHSNNAAVISSSYLCPPPLSLSSSSSPSSPAAAAAAAGEAPFAALDNSKHPLMLFASTAVHNGIWSVSVFPSFTNTLSVCGSSCHSLKAKRVFFCTFFTFTFHLADPLPNLYLACFLVFPPFLIVVCRPRRCCQDLCLPAQKHP
jgi:hypothetical protein